MPGCRLLENLGTLTLLSFHVEEMLKLAVFSTTVQSIDFDGPCPKKLCPSTLVPSLSMLISTLASTVRDQKLQL